MDVVVSSRSRRPVDVVVVEVVDIVSTTPKPPVDVVVVEVVDILSTTPKSNFPTRS